MDDKKKILLGEKDIISKDNEDIFINLNLNKNFSEIRIERYENTFDVEKQFNKERNECRNFRIYGTIDSTVVDSDNLNINVYANQNFTNSFIKTIKSSPLVYNEVNAFGKKRGKYLLELDNYNYDFVYMVIPGNGLNYLNQTFVQQVIFKDLEGNFIEYGTNTIEIDENGNTIGIDNDFYFFYDKHWIKKDLLISRARTSNVSFSAKTNPVTVSESNSNFTTFAVSLDQPSTFGFEKVDIQIDSRALDNNAIEIRLTDGNFNLYPQPPFTLSFAAGEQNKIINFQSLNDGLFEPTENVVFKLGNFQQVNPGSALTHTISVININSAPPPPPPPAVRKVTFEKQFDFMTSTHTVKITLDNNSVLGNESIVVSKAASSTAFLGLDYSETTTLPTTISWAVGEKDKFLYFQNIKPFFMQTKQLDLQITNLTNLQAGSYLTESLVIT